MPGDSIIFSHYQLRSWLCNLDLPVESVSILPAFGKLLQKDIGQSLSEFMAACGKTNRTTSDGHRPFRDSGKMMLQTSCNQMARKFESDDGCRVEAPHIQ